jgi:hypothetical protein
MINNVPGECGEKGIFLIKDIPKEVTDEMICLISPYCVGIVGIVVNGNKEDGYYIGSGSLVKIDGKHYVLTAGHVLAHKIFHNADLIGLSFSINVPRYAIEKGRLVVKYRWQENRIQYGPDLGLILIPDEKIAWLKEFKSFWEIDSKKKDNLSIGNLDGAWGICGCVNEMTTFTENELGYSKKFHFHHNLWLTGVEAEYTFENYDYFDTHAVYDDDNNLPSHFGGLSGGGLWQIGLTRNANMKLQIIDVSLQGVAFYQEVINNKTKLLRCHGRKSIYDKIFEIL